jgi:hypothetical protein
MATTTKVIKRKEDYTLAELAEMTRARKIRDKQEREGEIIKVIVNCLGRKIKDSDVEKFAKFLAIEECTGSILSIFIEAMSDKPDPAVQTTATDSDALETEVSATKSDVPAAAVPPTESDTPAAAVSPTESDVSTEGSPAQTLYEPIPAQPDVPHSG